MVNLKIYTLYVVIRLTCKYNQEDTPKCRQDLVLNMGPGFPLPKLSSRALCYWNLSPTASLPTREREKARRSGGTVAEKNLKTQKW